MEVGGARGGMRRGKGEMEEMKAEEDGGHERGGNGGAS
jgi:hypothetical protein